MNPPDSPYLSLLGVDFFEVTFKSMKPIDDDGAWDKQEITPSAIYSDEQRDEFKIVLHLLLEKTNYFMLELRAVGHFKLLGDSVATDVKKDLINRNATAIVFPYVRSFVSFLTSAVGRAAVPICLPVKFFKSEVPVITPPIERDSLPSDK